MSTRVVKRVFVLEYCCYAIPLLNLPHTPVLLLLRFRPESQAPVVQQDGKPGAEGVKRKSEEADEDSSEEPVNKKKKKAKKDLANGPSDDDLEQDQGKRTKQAAADSSAKVGL